MSNLSSLTQIALRRFSVWMLLAGLLFAPLAARPAFAHDAPGPFPTDCFDFVPHDGSISINRPLFRVYDSISPNGSYAQVGQNRCEDYWHVGVYNATGRTIRIRPWWGHTPPTTEAVCVHTNLTYFVWGLRLGGSYENLGGGLLYGVWTGRSCIWQADNPYTRAVVEHDPESIDIQNSPYFYYRVAAKVYHHVCAQGTFCPDSVRVRVYAYPSQ